MATVTWSSSSSTSWNTGANWSGGSVPGSSDDVVFDGTSTVNCTLDVDAQTIASLDVQSGYTGTLDFGDSGYDFTVSGDATFAGGGTVDLGQSNLTFSGNFDSSSQSTWTAVYSNQTIVLNGTNKLFWPKNGGYHDKITIDGTIYTNSTYHYASVGDLIINASKSLTLNGTSTSYILLIYDSITNNGQIISNATHSTSKIYCSSAALAGTGSWTSSSGYGYLWLRNSSTYISGQFSIPVRCAGNCYLLITGSTTFNDDAELCESGETATVDTQNNNITFNGDLINDTGLTWTAGTGTITISGDVPQDINFNGQTVEDIEIDTSSTVTLTGDVDTDSLTLTNGTLDVNGQTDVNVTGNIVMAAGTTITDGTV